MSLESNDVNYPVICQRITKNLHNMFIFTSEIKVEKKYK